MKRILSLIIAVALSLGTLALASCNTAGNIKINPDKEKYVIGIVQLAPHEALDAATQGFMDALEAKLTAAGREVEFKLQNAQGDNPTCTTIVNSFVADDVDLIMANATAALLAAANATATIPVLGTSITEYGVALQINNFNGTVGGNISGTSDLAPLEEQAQMMVDTLGLDNTKTVGLLYCSSELNSKYQVDVVGAYLENLGIAVEHFKFADSNELQTVCQSAVSRADAIYVPTDNIVAANTGIISNVCEPLGIPVFAGEENICKGCGYATLSISYYNIGQKTGEMAAQILLGQISISETPIAYDASPVKKYNKEICDKLGIDTDALDALGYTPIVTE